MESEDGLDLGPFVAATRRELDRAARQHRSARVPPVPSRPRRRAGVSLLVAAGVVLAAAAVVAALRGDLLVSDAGAPAFEAEHQLEPHGPDLVAPHHTADRPVLETAPSVAKPAATAPAASGVAAESGVASKAVEAVSAGPHGGAATRPRRASSDELRRLDAEAQRKWRAGDLAGAEALFLELVEKGGRTSFAELAFGDLFTLAHQRGDTRGEQQRWRRYLARFPHGRFADDVRAWQCRRATGSAAAECWRRYLADWPRGTYRAEALRASR